MEYKHLLNIAGNVIISIIVALITTKIAIKEFYKQEIWLRKESKYSKIIDNLSILRKYYGDIFDKFVGMSEILGVDDLIEQRFN